MRTPEKNSSRNMASVNNNTEDSLMPEPTMKQLYAKICENVTKSDLTELTSQINLFASQTNEKIEKINVKVDTVTSQVFENTDKIELLESNIESLKQDQLKNNICLSGVPPTLITNENSADLLIEIAKKLGVELTKNQFSAYPVASKKFIIVRFYNLKHKQNIISKIRVKRSLMVEEVFNMQSNGQIYINDHLTPFYNKLYLLARTAKKDGKLSSASSYGGKIRARINADDPPILITTERQLLALIDASNGNDTINSIQHIDEMMDASHSTSRRTANTSASSSQTKPQRGRSANATQKKSKRKLSQEKNKTTNTTTNKKPKEDQKPTQK